MLKSGGRGLVGAAGTQARGLGKTGSRLTQGSVAGSSRVYEAPEVSCERTLGRLTVVRLCFVTRRMPGSNRWELLVA